MQKINRSKNKIIPQMHDVRPVNSKGDLDLEKINRFGYVQKNNVQSALKFCRVEVRNTSRDTRQSTPQEDEIKRFQAVLDEEKKILAKNKTAISVLQNTNAICKAGVKNEKVLLEKKLTREDEFILVCEQFQKRREIEMLESELFSKKIALKKIKQKKAKLKKERLLESRRTKNLFIHRLQSPSNFISKLGMTPFWLVTYLLNKLITLGKSIGTSVKNSFEIFTFQEIPYLDYQDKGIGEKKTFPFFAVASCIFLLVFSTGFFYWSLKAKELAVENGKIAYASLTQAKEGIEKGDFDMAIFKFNDAYERFSVIQKEIDRLGSVIVDSSQYIPYLSKLSSGKHLSDAGKNISRIGALATGIIKTLDNIKNPLDSTESVSYLKIFQDSDKNLTEIALLINELEGNLDKIELEDIPVEKRSFFVELKKKLPEINKFVTNFAEEEKILIDVLGGNGPRKYLFLFQNNQEMRATGGFIGTYAVLDIFNGNVKSFFVDGIFNPDGQLREKIIPPVPIQKISATWSLHDSNWFPDFPISAEKASWFYEKTGGPTVDGVITMTPTVMQKLLEITGPIDMPEYDITIDKDNFLERIQYEVEVDYDKELNQPKKILADLAPKVLDQVFNAKNISDIIKTMDVLLASLNEKHILIYAKNYAVEEMLSANGWSGEVLDTKKDYLSVINTNINGYKTDGVIDEKIEHTAEIQIDGSIINTVMITRKHNGGNTPYDWWNRVNANYMRVYVPKGSQLIQATGQTNEFNSPPIDYHALGFKKDAQVGMEEDSIVIDSENGTRIYEDSGKTVFANWVYVSPQESVTMSYSYLLPFKLDTNLTTNLADTYSLLAQKQSGSIGSEFSTKIIYPSLYKVIWKYPDENVFSFSTDKEMSSGIELKSDLRTDKFIGIAFEKNNP